MAHFRWFSQYQTSVASFAEKHGIGEVDDLLDEAEAQIATIRERRSKDDVRKAGGRLMFILASLAIHTKQGLGAFANELPSQKGIK